MVWLIPLPHFGSSTFGSSPLQLLSASHRLLLSAQCCRAKPPGSEGEREGKEGMEQEADPQVPKTSLFNSEHFLSLRPAQAEKSV